mmetsp:Transcript_22999/g.48207  ORF Transcript_22999/g.48207 Transcript_22999/m.48207 type:complete len:126 (+) Transcript_22999:408-785(+)
MIAINLNDTSFVPPSQEQHACIRHRQGKRFVHYGHDHLFWLKNQLLILLLAMPRVALSFRPLLPSSNSTPPPFCMTIQVSSVSMYQRTFKKNDTFFVSDFTVALLVRAVTVTNSRKKEKRRSVLS